MRVREFVGRRESKAIRSLMTEFDACAFDASGSTMQKIDAPSAGWMQEHDRNFSDSPRCVGVLTDQFTALNKREVRIQFVLQHQ